MGDLLLTESEYACLKAMVELFEKGNVYCKGKTESLGLTKENRFPTLRMFEENGLIGNPQNNAVDGFYESFTIRSKTMQVLRSLEASERKTQEAIRLQQEQREHDRAWEANQLEKTREWEADQQEKTRIWQANQETIRHQREDKRDKITWTIAISAIVISLVGLGATNFLKKEPTINVQPTVAPAPIVNVIIPTSK